MEKPTHHDVTRLLGEMTDQKAVEVLETGASIAELEQAAAWIAGQDDVMGEARLPLEGAAAQVYQILARDEELARQVEDER